MSADEVISFFSPARESIDVVVEWLTSAGIDIDRISQSVNKQVSSSSHKEVSVELVSMAN